jgi:purine-nucleoside/S-methyl-5'-thioadenosine phosphorylase / adenosine deaminase
MTKQWEQNTRFGEFPASGGTHCHYAMFSRHGGVSEGPYASLNVGDRVGDREAAVLENRARVRKMLAVPRILSAKQVHGSEIFSLTEPLTDNLEVAGFDALITDQPGVGLMIQQADCQAVLLFDPVQEVIGAVHCGWRGSVQRLVERVIAVMAENHGTIPADMHAAISPSLGPCCAEFVNHRRELPAGFRQFMGRENYFDFWQITRAQLINAGMTGQCIRSANICTCCSGDYFSYRRTSRLDQGSTGRHCSVIALNKGVAATIQR